MRTNKVPPKGRPASAGIRVDDDLSIDRVTLPIVSLWVKGPPRSFRGGAIADIPSWTTATIPATLTGSYAVDPTPATLDPSGRHGGVVGERERSRCACGGHRWGLAPLAAARSSAHDGVVSAGGAHRGSAVLEFDVASKRFGSLQALDACSFTASPGRLTGFLGPNGAGKTTAMRTVFGLVELDSGAVRWQGGPIGPQQRARFGYMPEERGLYPRMRVRDQLVYLGRLCARSTATVSRTVDTWLERLGISSRADDRLDSLSHGNQQRVQLIAALVNEPELLVLDEPFSGLDPLAMTAMSEMLAEVAAAGTTVLFSSHQLDLVEDICEDVVIINAGRVVRAGDLAELRAEVPQRFVTIRYRGSPPDWSRSSAVGGIQGVEAVEQHDGQARLRVEKGVDIAAMVIAVQRSTDLVSFAYEPPTLSELFRQAVAA